MGFVAAGLLLVAEFTLVLWLRGMSIREYFASRDPVAGLAGLECLPSCRFWWLEDDMADPIPCCALGEILSITPTLWWWGDDEADQRYNPQLGIKENRNGAKGY
jgi:hypothetical protein